MQRRHFLKSLSLAGAFSAVPAAFSRSAGQPGIKELKGRVHSGGKGIRGVSVSDGRNVVATDAQGRYVLPAHEGAEFVFISVPAGYAFPQEQGIARFYQPVSERTSGSFDFSLEKLTVPDERHCFVIWADTQMISREDADQLKQTSAPDLKTLVASYPQGTLFHGIGCGDLVWDRFDLFKDYKEAIGLTGVPFYNVIGNHDMDIDARTDEYSARTFKQEFGPTYYSFNRGAIHYVVLDDVFFVGTAKKYIGYITENQLAWLEKDLSFVKPGTTVVLSVHIPTNTGASRRTGKAEEFGGTVSNRKQLYKLLAPYKVHIMSGHTHVNESWEEEGVMEHNHGTVCGAWWTGPVCSDGTPNGYGVYEVEGSELRWYYKATGMDRDHQLRIYDRGHVPEKPEEIACNVWNWDAQWKVEWEEDGVPKGPMTRRVGLDPLAMELYKGPELPQKHRFVEPTLADHLFYAVPSREAKAVRVTATDRFGKVYSGQLPLKGRV